MSEAAVRRWSNQTEVDAGTRQLAQTRWMDNRAHMLTSNFLVKELLIDRRRGERWFLQHLVVADAQPQQ